MYINIVFRILKTALPPRRTKMTYYNFVDVQKALIQSKKSLVYGIILYPKVHDKCAQTRGRTRYHCRTWGESMRSKIYCAVPTHTPDTETQTVCRRVCSNTSL